MGYELNEFLEAFGLPGAGRLLWAPALLRPAVLLSLSGSGGGLSVPEAAPLFSGAFKRRHRRAPTLAELDSLLCVSRFDGGLGSWPVDSAMYNSRNLGAIQCPNVGDDCSPEAQRGRSCAPLHTWEILHGERVEMVECFATYPTWDAGAEAFIAEMTAPRRPRTGAALGSGSLRRVAAEMRLEHYFTADAEAYAVACSKQEPAIARALGRAPAVSLDGPGGSGGGLALVVVGVGAVGAAAAFLLSTRKPR